MTNRKNKSSDPAQGSLLQYIEEAQQLTSQLETQPEGSLDVTIEFKAAMSEDIRQAVDERGRPLSRFDIAGTMSKLSGRTITKERLDNWTATAHDKHLMPSAYLPCFVIATGGRRAMEVIGRRCGLFVMPGTGALRAEIKKLEEQRKKITEDIRNLSTVLRLNEDE